MPMIIYDGNLAVQFGFLSAHSTFPNNRPRRDGNLRVQAWNKYLRVKPDGHLPENIRDYINQNNVNNTYWISRQNLLKHHVDLLPIYCGNEPIYHQIDNQNPQDWPLIDFELWTHRLQNLLNGFGAEEFLPLFVNENGLGGPLNGNPGHNYLYGTNGTDADDETWEFLQQFLLPGEFSCPILVRDQNDINRFVLHISNSEQHDELQNADGENQILPLPPNGYPRNWLWYGAPGTGKSYGLEQRARSLIVLNGGDPNSDFFPYSFSPATSYGDFVGEYRPNMIYNTNEQPPVVDILGEVPEPNIPGTPIINYSFTPGIFIQALIQALTNDNPVVLLIDEINRGDIYEILGEVFQLMERNENGEGEYCIALNQSTMDHVNATTGLQMDTIQLPENLYIWGTMNPNDSSVQQIDSAFFRRWIVRYISIDYQTENAEERDMILIEEPLNVRWGELRFEINRLLGEMGYDEEEFIGRYFVKRNEFSNWTRFYSKLVFHLANNVMKGNLQENRIFSATSVREIMRTCEEGGNPFQIDEFNNAQFGIEEVVEPAVEPELEPEVIEDNPQPILGPALQPGQAEDGPLIEGEE